MDSPLLSVMLILAISAAVVVTGVRRRPGVGILFSIIIAASGLMLGRRGLDSLGFASPIGGWPVTVLLAMGLGAVMALFSSAVVEPLAERLTGKEHDYAVFAGLRGNLKGLLVWLATVWVLVALLEETLFRGFLMNETARLLGYGIAALATNLLFNALIFGIAHAYQGPSGVISTAVMGGFLGLVFISAGFNLWLPILVHGFVDTFGLALIYLDLDRRVRTLFWKPLPARPGTGEKENG